MPAKMKTKIPKNKRYNKIGFYNAIEDFLHSCDVPDYYYSIGEQADDCVCLEYDDGRWIIYDGYRGNKIHKRSYSTVYEAGCDLIESVVVAESDEQLSRLKDSLRNRLNRVPEQIDIGRYFLEDFVVEVADDSGGLLKMKHRIPRQMHREMYQVSVRKKPKKTAQRLNTKAIRITRRKTKSKTS